MSAVKSMQVAQTLLKLCPSLVKSEESVNKLIMRGLIDFNTGISLIRNIKSTEEDSADTTVPEVVESPTTINFPSTDSVVVIKTVLELSSDDDKVNFNLLLDKLNLAFETSYNKLKLDIVRVLSQIVEINPEESDTAAKVATEIKDGKIIFIQTA